MGRVYDRAGRRFLLVYLVTVAECHRAGRPTIRRWAALALPHACAQVGCEWTGRLDREWVRDELAKVKAEPGEYPEETYERFRASGLPIWAALAAGMTPTPGSRALANSGRSTLLP